MERALREAGELAPGLCAAAAFTRHLSPLLGDVVALLAGCARVAADAAAQEPQQAGPELSPELRRLFDGVTGFLADMGAERTLEYLCLGLQQSGALA
jgi:hypothetical protein